MIHRIHRRTGRQTGPKTPVPQRIQDKDARERLHLDQDERRARMSLDNIFPRVPELDYEKRVDNCPECMARHVTPATIETVPNGAQCSYECHVCGCDWTTSWWEGEG